MKDDSILAYDLESLKIAARELRHNCNQSRLSNQRENRTDIVHAGYRFLQCIPAAIVFMYHVVVDRMEEILDVWNYTVVIIYPSCFIASFVLGVVRIMNFIPNPNPIIPVIISVTGWLAMLTGGVMAMRHAHLKLDIEIMTDDELAMDPIFRHDLILCSLSLVGSSLYLVHAWLCYDCWRWQKQEKKLSETANTLHGSSSISKSDADSGMSSNDETEPNSQEDSSASTLPGTSGGQEKSLKSRYRKSSRASRLFNKLRKPLTIKPEQADTLATLNEILQSSIHAKQIKVEDEPVKLYCCCVGLGNLIKAEYWMNVPVHEFHVVHVM